MVLALSLPIRPPVHRAADTGAGPVDGDLLWMAVGLVLVFEGLFPLLAPRAWRRTFLRMVELREGQLRFFGLLSVTLGLLIVAWLSN